MPLDYPFHEKLLQKYTTMGTCTVYIALGITCVPGRQQISVEQKKSK